MSRSIRRRCKNEECREWFHPNGHQAALVLWWLPAGRVPTLRQGISRLGRLRAQGPTPDAFTFREQFPAPVLI